MQVQDVTANNTEKVLQESTQAAQRHAEDLRKRIIEMAKLADPLAEFFQVASLLNIPNHYAVKVIGTSAPMAPRIPGTAIKASPDLLNKLLAKSEATRAYEGLIKFKEEAPKLLEDLDAVRHKIGEVSNSGYNMAQDTLRTIDERMRELDSRLASTHSDYVSRLTDLEKGVQIHFKKVGQAQLEEFGNIINSAVATLARHLETIDSDVKAGRDATGASGTKISGAVEAAGASYRQSLEGVTSMLSEIKTRVNALHDRQSMSETETEASLSKEITILSSKYAELSTTNHPLLRQLLDGPVETFGFYRYDPKLKLLHVTDASLDDVLDAMKHNLIGRNLENLRSMSMSVPFNDGQTDFLHYMATQQRLDLAGDMTYNSVSLYTNLADNHLTLDNLGPGLTEYASKRLGDRAMNMEDLQEAILTNKIKPQATIAKGMTISLRPNSGTLTFEGSPFPLGTAPEFLNPTTMMGLTWNEHRYGMKEHPLAIKSAVFVERKVDDGAAYLMVLSDSPHSFENGSISAGSMRID